MHFQPTPAVPSLERAVARFAVSLIIALAALVSSRAARAEESIIKSPGQHPTYSVELEPHLAFGFFVPSAGSGVGIGGRVTIPIVRNGFVKSINNSVGIGFGLDWIHYSGCFFVRDEFGDCAALNRVWIPVVMQWNFYLSNHWTVFGEPGLAITYSDWGGDCVVANGNRVFICGPSPNRVDLQPVIIFLGGAFRFSQGASLTMRVGWPYASIGVSFFP
jgi:hypothetical protein